MEMGGGRPVDCPARFTVQRGREARGKRRFHFAGSPLPPSLSRLLSLYAYIDNKEEEEEDGRKARMHICPD